MNSLRPENLGKDKKLRYNKIEVVKKLFRLNKKIDVTTGKDIRNLLKLKKENQAIKNRIIRRKRNLFENEKKLL